MIQCLILLKIVLCCDNENKDDNDGANEKENNDNDDDDDSSDHDRDIQQDDQFGFCLNMGEYLESDDSKRLNDAFRVTFGAPLTLGYLDGYQESKRHLNPGPS